MRRRTVTTAFHFWRQPSTCASSFRVAEPLRTAPAAVRVMPLRSFSSELVPATQPGGDDKQQQQQQQGGVLDHPLVSFVSDVAGPAVVPGPSPLGPVQRKLREKEQELLRDSTVADSGENKKTDVDDEGAFIAHEEDDLDYMPDEELLYDDHEELLLTNEETPVEDEDDYWREDNGDADRKRRDRREEEEEAAIEEWTDANEPSNLDIDEAAETIVEGASEAASGLLDLIPIPIDL